MAYYDRPDPLKLFRDHCQYCRRLINIAISEGFTEEQAVELIKIKELKSIGVNLDAISYLG